MLIGEKVILRPIAFEDWEKTLQWRNDLEIKSSTLSHPFPITAEQEQEWYRDKLSSYDNRSIHFTIVTTEKGEAIGFIHLNSIDMINSNCHFGVVIGEKRDWGKGFGKEAVKLILNYAFSILNMNKVYCQVIKKHPSIKTYFDLGGIEEGSLKHHVFKNGNYEDVYILAWYPESLKL